MSDNASLVSNVATCLCGNTQITFKKQGKPAFVALCHCSICRFSCAAPSAHIVGLKRDQVEMPNDDATSYYEIPSEKGGLGLRRTFCKTCGTRVYNDWSHSEAYKAMSDMIGVSATLFSNGAVVGRPGEPGIAGTDLAPTMHIFYADRVMDVNDDLPKFLDLPKAFGGSGTMHE